MNIGVISLGCTKNQVDTEIMQGLLLKAGFMLVDDHKDADVILVNTCGFIESAKTESIEAILTAARYKRARCRVLVVAGCLSQRYANELMQELPEIDAMVGTNTLQHVVEAIKQALAGARPLFIDNSHYDYRDVLDRNISTKHSVYVKIAEGCDNRCSYCAIPIIRGSFRSRSLEQIEAEVRMLAAKGAREINLIAQDTTRYGLERYGELALPDLLRKLLAIAGPQWFRLLYCYPANITDDLIELMAREERILKYIDLPLQHISQPILSAMGRRGTAVEIRDLLARLRRQIPDIVVRTTFIVGFPGETVDDFEVLYDFVREARFDHVGIFKFSREEGTAAFDLPDQVPEDVKEQRYHDLMSLQQEISSEKNGVYLGLTTPVLLEKVWNSGRGMIGRAMKDAPDVDGRVYVQNLIAEIGEIVPVRITRAGEYDLWGVKNDDSSQ